ncbi:tyrosine-type recombinase/integrase [uncultured Eudoraea sp.]|uniref:tyrosine-type recombinase/integrase n=1 Tax=uncultured Eudoraea sp. TaxID=1035614 RepID=UPI0026311402|nr:tyrosine-type recombinase/integrase [uncultured Eudoraea sp.]
MKTVLLISIRISGRHWLKVQSDPLITANLLAEEFKGAQKNEPDGSTLLPYTNHLVNELFAYFRAKGYYVDYSKVKFSKNPRKPDIKQKRNGKQELLTGRNKRYYNSYISYLEGLRLSNSTINVYSNFIIDFLIYIKKRELRTVRNSDVQRFTETMVKKKAYGISSHRQMVSAIKHFANRFEETEIDQLELKRPHKDRRLPTVLSYPEIIRLLQVTANLKHRTAIALLYSAGLRISELLELKLSALDIERSQILIRNSKGRKDRYVVMAQSFIPLLKNYLNTYKPGYYFIENPNGHRYSASSVRKFLRRSCKMAGITKHVTPHTLRHSYATHLIENGVGLRYVQELLGHSKPETTMIYTHVAQKDLLQIRSPLDEAVLGLLQTDKKPKKVYLSGKFL